MRVWLHDGPRPECCNEFKSSTESSSGNYACGDDGSAKIGSSGFCNQHRGNRKSTPIAMWIGLDKFDGAVLGWDFLF